MSRGLGVVQRRVLELLAARRDAAPGRPWEWWAWTDELAGTESRASVESVRRALRGLRRAGAVEVEQRLRFASGLGRRAYRYRLPLGDSDREAEAVYIRDRAQRMGELLSGAPS